MDASIAPVLFLSLSAALSLPTKLWHLLFLKAILSQLAKKPLAPPEYLADSPFAF